MTIRSLLFKKINVERGVLCLPRAGAGMPPTRDYVDDSASAAKFS